MSVTMKGKSTGTTTVELQHESGAIIVTTAPKDNGGDGSSFSPTDLCSVSLGACGTTIMSMFCKTKDINLEKIEFDITKEMSPAPRKIAKLTISYKIFSNCSEKEFSMIVNAGKTCPVRLTLSGNVEIVETYTQIKI